MTLSVGKVGSVFRTRIPGLQVEFAKIGAGSSIEVSFNKHAKTIKDFVISGLEKGGRLPDGRRVSYHHAGNKDFYQVFFAPNRSKWPDVSYETSSQGSSIITEKLKYFQNSQNIIRHILKAK